MTRIATTFAIALAVALSIVSCESRGRRESSTSAPPVAEAPPPAPAPATVPPSHPQIRVSRPSPGERVTSPLVVRGEARGPWYFEASFPVRLLDERGALVTASPAQAKGEWMTPEFVPFEAVLSFSTDSPGGTLVLDKSNASGLPEHADSVVVPVRFR